MINDLQGTSDVRREDTHIAMFQDMNLVLRAPSVSLHHSKCLGGSDYAFYVDRSLRRLRSGTHGESGTI